MLMESPITSTLGVAGSNGAGGLPQDPFGSSGSVREGKGLEACVSVLLLISVFGMLRIAACAVGVVV
jgi:hypothetical protein